MEKKPKITWCDYCEEHYPKTENIGGHNLCEDCANKYDDKTGYCSLNCCITGQCGQEC